MADLTPISPGVMRVAWDLAGHGRVDAVKTAVAQALADGAHRVEAWVDVADHTNQRVATFAGLRKEGIARGVHAGVDQIVYAVLATDPPVTDPEGFRALLNAVLPRKRAISQLLVRSTDGRVLLCQLTYKSDWDLPGGVVEVGESPQIAVSREVHEELALDIAAGPLLLTDWLPSWSGWDDALCLVFDGGEHPAELADTIEADAREIRSARFCTLDEVNELCADFTARRIHSAMANLAGGPSYVEGGG